MSYNPGDRVFYIHRHGGNESRLPGTIEEPGLREGTWRIKLENHRLTVTANEGDLVPRLERDY
jgi:hypothetical protein